MKPRCVCALLQNGYRPEDLAKKAGHMSIVRLMGGPDTYQQNLDAGLGGQVSVALHSLQSMLSKVANFVHQCSHVPGFA